VVVLGGGWLKNSLPGSEEKSRVFHPEGPFLGCFQGSLGPKRRFLRHFYVKMGAKVAQNGVKMA